MGPKKKAENTGNRSKGEFTFRSFCMGCHAVTATSSSMGPSLKGLYERRVAACEDFAYGSFLSSKATERWSDKSLNHWLKMHKGPKNAIKSQKERDDIIAFLRSV